jgi:hypothetical protein
MRVGTVWDFQTARFAVRLEIERCRHYKYDGEDGDGETQRGLDSGELVAFESMVVVELDGEEVTKEFLGGSVYSKSDYADFWTAHRDPDPLHRNSTAFRQEHGDHAVVGHYFPDMVRSAIREARGTLQRRYANQVRLRHVTI